MKNNAVSTIPSSLPAEKPTILIVDDSRLMRVAIKKILKDDFSLIEAVDGEDAWGKLCGEPAIKGIFSDLSMPNLDGYGLLARVRASSEKQIRDLPFVVITGKEGDLQGLLEEVRAHGATDLVGKPFKTDEIIERTKAFLAVQEPEAEVEEASVVVAQADSIVDDAVIEAIPVVAEIPETDALTGLLNETSFLRTAARMLEIARQQGTAMALLRMQLDNDSEPDGATDAMILTVADVIRAQLPGRYSAAHLGNGQFAILLSEENTIGALAWAQRLLDESVKHAAGLSISGGIDATPLSAEIGLEALRTAAEQRMLVAAAAGGQRIFHDDLITLETLAEEKRLAAEAARREAEEIARQQAEAQARAIAEQEQEAARQRAEAEAARRRAEEEARQNAEAEARLAAEQAERERLAREDEARRCEEIRATVRRMAEENERRRLEQEAERLRFNFLQALFVRMALPFMSLGNRLFRLHREAQLAALRKRLP